MTKKDEFDISDDQKRIDLSDQINKSYGKHRSGWSFAIINLSPLHNHNGYYFDSFIESSFTWDSENILKHRRPWIGVMHVPPNVPDWFMKEQSNHSIFKLDEWEQSLQFCKGIYTLSVYHKESLEKQLDVPVNALFHPTEPSSKVWEADRFLENRYKKIYQIGWWLRKLHGIFQLKVNSYQKCFVKPDHLPFLDDLIRVERDILKGQGQLQDSDYDTVETLPFFSNEDYDEVLSTNVVFVNLYDTSANNLIIECMARNTPILVNPLPAVIEYLGKDYPLYYDSMEEAAEKAENFDLILAANEFLKNHPNKNKLEGEYFRQSLINSPIYDNLDFDIGNEYLKLRRVISFYEKDFSHLKNDEKKKDALIKELGKELDLKKGELKKTNTAVKRLKEELDQVSEIIYTKERTNRDLQHDVGILEQKKSDLYEDIYHYEQLVQNVLNWKAYRLGRFLIYPLSRFKQIVNSGKHRNNQNKLAFIDHSFHKKSMATEFLIALLKRHFDVSLFWDNSWDNGPKVNLFKLRNDGFRHILFFQSYKYSEAELKQLNGINLIVVPMYDGSAHFDFDFWKKYQQLKIINFSKNLDTKLNTFGLSSKYFKYFPNPAEYEEKKTRGKLLNGFFWQRIDQINWYLIKTLIGDTRFKRIVIHKAMDPATTNSVWPSDSDKKKYKIEYSEWFKSRKDYHQLLKKSDVFFAPRLFEGIGMSFLEAMAMGLCVVAPDHPTMNEYIEHGVNGLLYDPHNPTEIDFSDAKEIGKRARQYIIENYLKWEKSESDIINFIKDPGIKNKPVKIFLSHLKMKMKRIKGKR